MTRAALIVTDADFVEVNEWFGVEPPPGFEHTDPQLLADLRTLVGYATRERPGGGWYTWAEVLDAAARVRALLPEEDPT